MDEKDDQVKDDLGISEEEACAMIQQFTQQKPSEKMLKSLQLSLGKEVKDQTKEIKRQMSFEEAE